MLQSSASIQQLPNAWCRPVGGCPTGCLPDECLIVFGAIPVKPVALGPSLAPTTNTPVAALFFLRFSVAFSGLPDPRIPGCQDSHPGSPDATPSRVVGYLLRRKGAMLTCSRSATRMRIIGCGPWTEARQAEKGTHPRTKYEVCFVCTLLPRLPTRSPGV
jgi:hypothetical protein